MERLWRRGRMEVICRYLDINVCVYGYVTVKLWCALRSWAISQLMIRILIFKTNCYMLLYNCIVLYCAHFSCFFVRSLAAFWIIQRFRFKIQITMCYLEVRMQSMTKACGLVLAKWRVRMCWRVRNANVYLTSCSG